VTILTGASPHGQGQETSFAQIAADELGVDINDVTVIHGDTGIVQYGIGTFGSRATAVGGTTMGADPIACAALSGGADVKAFFVRKDRKEHGLQRWIEGPLLDDGDTSGTDITDSTTAPGT